VLWSELYYN